MSKESLPRKKKIRAGHRASATRLFSQIDTALTAPATDSDKLSQLKLSLHKKLETLKLLDSEIVQLSPEEGLEDEIEQADGYKENVYRALIAAPPKRNIIYPEVDFLSPTSPAQSASEYLMTSAGVFSR